jgi:hypothetical protein
MKSLLLLYLFTLCQFSAGQQRQVGQTDYTQSIAAAIRISEILKPHVASLDRDLWTFRYEGLGSLNFRPNNISEVIQHISSWANRFWNPELMNGADTGPGVYVATDPAATATWGWIHPQLFAIKIKRGSQILIGDGKETPFDEIKSLSAIASELGCKESSGSLKTGLGNAIGYFRMNQKRECRLAVIQALGILSVQAISYGFNSVPFGECRVTGTAISIIDSRAISLGEINMYSEAGNIEGKPSVTPFIHKLFEEAKGDYYSQSLLANREVLNRYKNAYGFFKSAKAINSRNYSQWKSQNVLKCGPKWSIELPEPKTVSLQMLRLQPDPRVKNLLIKMSLVYREKIHDGETAPIGTPAELKVERIRAIAKVTKKDLDTKILLFTARVPNITGNQENDKKTYLNLLQGCLKLYEAESISEISQSECRID